MKYNNRLKGVFVRLMLLFLIANIFLFFTYSSNSIKAFAQASCAQTLTINKVVGGSIDSATANNLPFAISLRINDVTVENSFILTQAHAVSRCVNAGDRINVADNGPASSISQFTFAAPSLSSDCSTIVQAGVNVNCTITDTVTGTTNSAAATPQAATIPAVPNVQPNTGAILIANANNTGHLKIITHNVNDCLPQSSCTNIASRYPTVVVHTLDENKYVIISEFPGSEVGRTVNLIVLAPGIQYDVSQPTGGNFGYPNMTTHSSPDCQGTMHANDNKVCTINNIIQNPTGHLKIITHNVNDCLPQSSCTNIASRYPTVVVHTLDENNKYNTISSFPGSEVGRTVNFQGIFPLGLQYDALQENPFPPNANITTHSSPDCQGTMHANDNKVCTINNNITSAS